MKHFVTAIVVVAFLVSCKSEPKKPETVSVNTTEAPKEKDPNAEYAKATFTIEGMTCAMGCAATIEKALNKKDGIAYAKVDFDNKLASVEYDKNKVSLGDLTTVVTSVSDTYTVIDAKNVDDFTATSKKDCKKENCDKLCDGSKQGKKDGNCNPDCKKEDCKEKRG